VSFDRNLQLPFTGVVPTSSGLRQQVPMNHLLMYITFVSATLQNQISILNHRKALNVTSVKII